MCIYILYSTLQASQASIYHIDTNVADCFRFFSFLEHKATLGRYVEYSTYSTYHNYGGSGGGRGGGGGR